MEINAAQWWMAYMAAEASLAGTAPTKLTLHDNSGINAANGANLILK